MKRWTAVFGTLTSVALALNSAGAQERGGFKKEGAGAWGPKQIFEKNDANRDGFLTQNEMPEWMRNHMGKLDKDGDGKISAGEMAQMPGPGQKPEGGFKPDANQIMQKLDANGDGQITRNEAHGPAAEKFNQLDANGDGKVSKDELQSALTKMAGGRGDKPEGEGNKEFGANKEKGETATKESAKDKGRMKQMMAQLEKADKNGDGKISRDEAPQQVQGAFDRLDSNGDGAIDKSELGKTMAAGPGGPGGGRPDMSAGLAPPRPNANNNGPRQVFNDQDADADGRVSKEEANGQFKERFDSLDSNKDGKLDILEVEKGAADREGDR